MGDTDHVDFDTTKPVRSTDPEKCHINYTVADSRWEHRVDMDLEDMGPVIRYVKNQGLGFTIPYTLDGQPRSYYPDFLVDLDDGHGADDPLHLVVEVSGERDREKQVKVDTARSLWIPAVNNAGRFGRWRFVEVTDPFEAADIIGAIVAESSRCKLMPPRKAPAKKVPPQVESVQHKDKRLNIPTEEQRDFVADAERDPIPVQYERPLLYPRDPDADPQLVWRGKDEQDRRSSHRASRSPLHPGEDRPESLS